MQTKLALSQYFREKTGMSAFATQFEVAIREMEFRQIDVVQKAGVSQTQVSRYLSGHNLPEMKSFEAMVAIFPDHIRERLVTAYLLDHIPPSASHLVTVQPVTRTKGKTALVYGKAAHGSEFAEALAFLEERGLQNHQVRDAIIATVRALRGDPLNLDLDMDDAPVIREDEPPSDEPPQAADGE